MTDADGIFPSFSDELISRLGPVPETELGQYKPLVLAYAGDAVFDLFVRTALVRGMWRGGVNRLHRAAVEYVKASAQSRIIRGISHMLTEDELDVVRRGRNSHSGYVPKNAVVSEYRYATGFEALLGRLYLSGDMRRLGEILDSAAACIRSGQEHENGGTAQADGAEAAVAGDSAAACNPSGQEHENGGAAQADGAALGIVPEGMPPEEAT